MEVTHTVNPPSGKHQRAEPKYLSAENREIMEDLGMDSGYCLPASNTNAKMQSLRFQCKRTIPNEGEPDYTPIADKIDEMGEFLMTSSVWGPATHDYKWLSEFCSGFDDKNSGWSKRWKALNKKDMFAKHGPTVLKIVFGRLLMRAVVGEELMIMTPHDKFMWGLADPRELSTKDEEHTVFPFSFF